MVKVAALWQVLVLIPHNKDSTFCSKQSTLTLQTAQSSLLVHKACTCQSATTFMMGPYVQEGGVCPPF